MMKRSRHFASDNCSGICPEAWASLSEANAGHEANYGNDTWTQRATDLIRGIFETDCEVFFVFNGTAGQFTGAGVIVPVVSCHSLP